ncbi:porin family protein [Mucilaginibacter ximonensis]|uniref:Porin family protein n=1 Tax=Mucilaginibacter ximonensis TaxID=538021 RepID=A0ABW5Y704_9SPHI
MKKIISSLCFILITYTAFAQSFGDNDNPITFGLMGGSDMAFLQIKSAHRDLVQTNNTSPFSLGFSADFKFNDYFSLRPAIFYAGKGGSMTATYTIDPPYKGANTNVDADNEYTLHYLEIPLQAVGHIPVGDGANIFIGAGPYYSYALNGKFKQSTGSGPDISRKLTFGNNGDFSSSDYGISSVIGFQGQSGWSLSGNLEFGLTNILRNNYTGFDASQMKTITVYLTIGQSF